MNLLKHVYENVTCNNVVASCKCNVCHCGGASISQMRFYLGLFYVAIMVIMVIRQITCASRHLTGTHLPKTKDLKLRADFFFRKEVNTFVISGQEQTNYSILLYPCHLFFSKRLSYEFHLISWHPSNVSFIPSVSSHIKCPAHRLPSLDIEDGEQEAYQAVWIV